LISAKDEHHDRVLEVFRKLKTDSPADRILTTNHVVSETITLVRRIGHNEATRIGDRLYGYQPRSFVIVKTRLVAPCPVRSAGSISLGSLIVRGWTEKPLLLATGHDKGFAFLKNVAIDPHLTEAKRDRELINVVNQCRGRPP
jgi:hypothetical protein